jgi:hypothetical protein
MERPRCEEDSDANRGSKKSARKLIPLPSQQVHSSTVLTRQKTGDIRGRDNCIQTVSEEAGIMNETTNEKVAQEILHELFSRL